MLKKATRLSRVCLSDKRKLCFDFFIHIFPCFSIWKQTCICMFICSCVCVYICTNMWKNKSTFFRSHCGFNFDIIFYYRDMRIDDRVTKCLPVELHGTLYVRDGEMNYGSDQFMYGLVRGHWIFEPWVRVLSFFIGTFWTDSISNRYKAKNYISGY